MRKPVLVAAAAAVFALVGVPAYAQGTVTPPSPSCAEALTKFQRAEQHLNKLELTVPGPPLSGAPLGQAVKADKRVVDAREAVAKAKAALDAAKAKLAAAVAADPVETPPVDSADTVQAKKDVADAEKKLTDAEAALASIRATVRDELKAKPTASVPNPAVAAATKKRDTAKVDADAACKGQPGAPGAPGAAAPPAGFVDLDCSDFPSQAAAQTKLNETPGADPHRLDTNSNRIACEGAENENTDPAPAPAPVVNTDGGGFTQVGGADVPVGGVNTGA